MPNIRNWEDWDEVEQETNQQMVREKISKKERSKKEDEETTEQQQSLSEIIDSQIDKK